MAIKNPVIDSPKRMKKFAFMVAAWFITIISVLVGSYLYEESKGSDLDQTVIPYLNKVIPELTKWDPAITKQLMAEEALENIPEERFMQAMTLFSKMGELKSIGEPEFEKVRDDELSSGTKTVISYKTLAKFENGDAEISFKLIETDGNYRMYRFNLSAETLFK